MPCGLLRPPRRGEIEAALDRWNQGDVSAPSDAGDHRHRRPDYVESPLATRLKSLVPAAIRPGRAAVPDRHRSPSHCADAHHGSAACSTHGRSRRTVSPGLRAVDLEPEMTSINNLRFARK